MNFYSRIAGLVLVLSLSVSFTEALYVYIPDSAFRSFLISDGYAPAFHGDSLDTTSVLVTSATSMNCSGMEIQSLDGIQYFSSLEQLDCSVNYLTSLPTLPASLTSLQCWKNQLTSLPDLPVHLVSLMAYRNQLTSLPVLPPDLTRLVCTNNLLTVLPALPPRMRDFECDSNFIQDLPELPDSLYWLRCGRNPIDSLPQLPASLRFFNCDRTLIFTLPSLPDSLYYLHVSRNNLTCLPTLPVNLHYLYCDYNHLDSLPVLPDSITVIDCTSNLISSLPALPVTLLELYVSGNNFSELPSMPPNLQVLYCAQNHLDSIPLLPSTLLTFNSSDNPLYHLPVLPSNLRNLICGNNLLSELPTLTSTLKILCCSGNSIHELLDLPDSLTELLITNNPIRCLPSIKYIGRFEWQFTSITCLPNLISIGSYANPAIDTVPLCQPSSGCEVNWNISGNVYHDLNFDCVKDTNEQAMKNIPVLLDSAGTFIQTCYTNTNGDYSFRTGLGNYEVRINPTNLPIPFLCPVSGSYVSQLTPVDSMDSNLNFALTCPNTFDLVACSVTPEIMFRPTRLVKVLVNAGDLLGHFGTACFQDTGYVECTFSGPIHYVGPAAGARTPVYSFPGTLRWNVYDFSQVDPSTDFNIEVRVDSFAPISSQVCFNLAVYPLIGDIFPLDNFRFACYPVRNSVDPNEKFMSPSGTVDTSDHVFNFTIFFQNTGNAPAEDIFIIDTLDNDLDATSFEFVSSSHPVVTQILPGNILRFNYHAINLTDSLTDESLSHGQVNFRVSRKSSTGMGTEISNTAYIYFDQNPPVATNTVSAVISSLMSAPGLTMSTVIAFPNPADRQVTIRTNNEDILSVEILDITGQSLLSKAGSNKPEMTMDISSLTHGLFLVRIRTRSGYDTCRFTK